MQSQVFSFPIMRKMHHSAPGVQFCFEIRNYKEFEITTEGEEEIYYVVQISLMQLCFCTISYRTLYVILCNLSVDPHSCSLIQGSVRQSEKFKAWVMLLVCSLEERIKLIDISISLQCRFLSKWLVVFRQNELLSNMSWYWFIWAAKIHLDSCHTVMKHNGIINLPI